MLGGPDSFADGKYDRTPVGELLPVYLNRPAPARAAARRGGEYRLVLTREGWLQPWVRTRKTEDEERQRLAAMPPFRTLSRVGGIKPGASVLAEVRDPAGDARPGPGGPAVRQGAGRRPADRRPLALGPPPRATRPRATSTAPGGRPSAGSSATSPAGSTCRSGPRPTPPAPAVEVVARVRDAEYRPLDNARVALKVALPGGGDADPRRRARRPRGRDLRRDLRPPPARRLPGRRHGRPPPTARPSARARPAGPPSPPPTSSPGSSPTATSSTTIAAQDRRRGRRRRPPRSLRRRPRRPGRPDHRALDLAPLAPPALLPRRHRLPGRRVGHPPGQRPGVMDRDRGWRGRSDAQSRWPRGLSCLDTCDGIADPACSSS